MLRRVLGMLTVGSMVLACSSGASPTAAPTAAPQSTPNSGDVQASEQEWQINLDSHNLTAGTHTFQIQNNGEKTHEFVIVKTALAEDALPVVDDEIPEDSDQIEAVDEVEDIEPGTNPSLTVDLAPGHYVIFCNLTAHYGKGMHASFDVS